jgi:hypothetical protein
MKTKYNFLTKSFLYKEHIKKGKTLRLIAKENDIPIGSMRYLMNSFNIKTCSIKETNRKLFYIKINKKQLVKLYTKEKKTIGDISKILNICQTTVWERLKEFNIPINKRIPKNKGIKKIYRCMDCGTEVSRSKSLRCIDCRGKNYSKTYRHSKKIKRKLSLLKGGNGIPYFYSGYSQNFNNELKTKIRERDNNQCQMCFLSQKENLRLHKRKLDVHHIDYNRKNCNVSNLISLCRYCHHKTNYKRKQWKKFFKLKIKGVKV